MSENTAQTEQPMNSPDLHEKFILNEAGSQLSKNSISKQKKNDKKKFDDEKMGSFCSMEVYKHTLVTDDQRKQLRFYCIPLVILAILDISIGAYMYSLTAGNYAKRPGSWYVGIMPIFVAFFAARVKRHIGLCINIANATFSALIALGGALQDIEIASYMSQLNACVGFNTYSWFLVSPDDYQKNELTICVSKAESSYVFPNGAIPSNVCMCTYGAESACTNPLPLPSSYSSCQILRSYGPLLITTFVFAVLTCFLNIVIIYLEISFIKARQREIMQKYGDLVDGIMQI